MGEKSGAINLILIAMIGVITIVSVIMFITMKGGDTAEKKMDNTLATSNLEGSWKNGGRLNGDGNIPGTNINVDKDYDGWESSPGDIFFDNGVFSPSPSEDIPNNGSDYGENDDYESYMYPPQDESRKPVIKITPVTINQYEEVSVNDVIKAYDYKGNEITDYLSVSLTSKDGTWYNDWNERTNYVTLYRQPTKMINNGEFSTNNIYVRDRENHWTEINEKTLLVTVNYKHNDKDELEKYRKSSDYNPSVPMLDVDRDSYLVVKKGTMTKEQVASRVRNKIRVAYDGRDGDLLDKVVFGYEYLDLDNVGSSSITVNLNNSKGGYRGIFCKVKVVE